MQFALEAAKVSLTHKNERLELHGEDKRLACDLDFEYETGNEILAQFHPELRSMLYKRPDDVQGELVEGELTRLRCDELGALKLSGKQRDCKLQFSRGKKVHLEFADATIGKFSLGCKDGGTVLVKFQAQVYPDEGQSGKLSGLLQDKVCLLTITLPGEAAGQPPKSA